MKPRHAFTTACFPAPCWATTNSWEFVLTGPEPEAKADLPEISAFLTKPSDCFLVDIKEG